MRLRLDQASLMLGLINFAVLVALLVVVLSGFDAMPADQGYEISAAAEENRRAVRRLEVEIERATSAARSAEAEAAAARHAVDELVRAKAIDSLLRR